MVVVLLLNILNILMVVGNIMLHNTGENVQVQVVLQKSVKTINTMVAILVKYVDMLMKALNQVNHNLCQHILVV